MIFCHHTINVRCPNCKSIAERHVTLHDNYDALEIRHAGLRSRYDELLADMRQIIVGWLLCEMVTVDGVDTACQSHQESAPCRIGEMRKKWGVK